MRIADNFTTFQAPIVLKSGSLNHLEPSGPVQACTGLAYITPGIAPVDLSYPGQLKKRWWSVWREFSLYGGNLSGAEIDHPFANSNTKNRASFFHGFNLSGYVLSTRLQNRKFTGIRLEMCW